jgi:hypothetical protein
MKLQEPREKKKEGGGNRQKFINLENIFLKFSESGPHFDLKILYNYK